MSLFSSVEKSNSLLCDRSNYDETAASICEIKSIKFDPLKQTAYVQCFFVTAVFKNWTVRSVKQKLDPLFEDFYLKAEEHPESGTEGEFRLKQIFYNGEPKRSKWLQGVTIFLRLYCFSPLDECPCIFRLSSELGDVYLLVFVDDIYVASESGHQVEMAISNLCKGVGSVIPVYPKPVMSPNLETTDKRLQINCEEFINRMLEDFTDNVKKADFEYDIPLLSAHFTEAMKETSSGLDCERDRKDWRLYKQTVEGLRYLAYHTRPDIALATALLEKGIDNVSELHWKMLLQLLHYLHKSKTLSLNFEFDNWSSLNAYYDVYFNPQDPGFYVLGFCLMYGNSLIAWSVEACDPVSFPDRRITNGHAVLYSVYEKIEAIEPLLRKWSFETKWLYVYGPYHMSKISNIYRTRGRGGVLNQCPVGTENYARMFTRPVPRTEMVQTPYSHFLTDFGNSTKTEEEKN